MTCRESRLVSAMSTFARCMTGLEDNQVLALSHSLMGEMPAENRQPTQRQWNAFIDSMVARYDAGRLFITPGSSDPRRRLEDARSQTPDAARMYAAERLVERCERAATAQEAFMRNTARDTGLSLTEVNAEFIRYFSEASDNARLRPSRDFESSFNANPDNSGLFVDRRSTYAYEQMGLLVSARRASTEGRLGDGNAVVESLARGGAAPRLPRTRRASATTRTTRPAVVREAVDSSSISEMGYDPTTQRLEIVFHANPERVYAYRIDNEMWEEMRNSSSVGSYYARHIRGQFRHQYNNEAEAESDGTRYRCPTCQEFAVQGAHDCPANGSEEQQAVEVRTAVRRRRARAAGEPAPAPEPTITRIAAVNTMRHPGDYGMLRIPATGRITATARSEQQVLVPVSLGRPGSTVTGFVNVSYAGRGQGYTVAPVTEPGDSSRDNLRCTCAEYRRRHYCEHMQAAVMETSAILNHSQHPSNREVIQATERVTASLGENHAASVEAIRVSSENWQGVRSSFVDDSTTFQELYDEYRVKQKEYKDAVTAGREAEYPVPFMRENALAGLATRGSGRGFGIEIEYSFPSGMSHTERTRSNREIGRELHALRLTSSDAQRYYGATHGRYTDRLAGGWSFEEDGSTMGGGEIISPVMYDEPNTWDNIEKVTEILHRHGAVASTHAGMHVHVGVGDYDHTIANHNRLLGVFTENTDLIYRLSTDPGRGTHRGSSYCAPNSNASSNYTSLSQATRRNAGHYVGLNLENVSGGARDHAEFRTFDSSLQPGVIQAQIAMSVFMTESALRPGSIDVRHVESHPLGERLSANPRRANLTGEAWEESTKPMRRFIDKFVPGTTENDKDNPHIRQFVSLFAMTKWQKARASSSW